MLKSKTLFISLLTTFFFTNQNILVHALELDEDTRTVAMDTKRNSVMLTLEQVKRGKRLFNNACSNCYVRGKYLISV
jgi:photosystem II cytochrome c550